MQTLTNEQIKSASGGIPANYPFAPTMTQVQEDGDIISTAAGAVWGFVKGFFEG